MNTPSKEEIKKIYEGIDLVEGLAYDPQGWNSDTPIFQEVIDHLHPKTIVEVGAWKGASTIHMARLCKALKLDTLIYSIDCWVGPLGVRLCPTPPTPIPKHWSEPTFYQQYLFNIHYAGCHDCVIPFQAMTVPAARVLRDWHVQPELIYVDAAHDFQSAWDDIHAYWPLLQRGGIMLGDDYRSQPGIHDVGSAVRKFAAQNRLIHYVTNETKDAQWWIKKP